MAQTPFKRIESREIYGADISGLQDAINKMEAVLDMLTTSVTNHSLLAVSDQPEPALHRRIYEGTIRNWLETPVPVIRRDGVVVSPAEYILYAAQGMIVFNQQQALGVGITADFTHIRAESPLSGHVGAGGGVHSAASHAAAGFMSATDKVVFDAWSELYLSQRQIGRYMGSNITGGTETMTVAANQVDVTNFYLPFTMTFDRIMVRVLTAVAGNCRIGVYASDPATFYPTIRLLNAGIVTTGTTGDRELTINLTLTRGWYWLARLHDAAPGLLGISGAAMPATMLRMPFDPAFSGFVTNFRIARTYAEDLPELFPGGAIARTGGQAAVFLRRAA